MLDCPPLPPPPHRNNLFVVSVVCLNEYIHTIPFRIRWPKIAHYNMYANVSTRLGYYMYKHVLLYAANYLSKFLLAKLSGINLQARCDLTVFSFRCVPCDPGEPFALMTMMMMFSDWIQPASVNVTMCCTCGICVLYSMQRLRETCFWLTIDDWVEVLLLGIAREVVRLFSLSLVRCLMLFSTSAMRPNHGLCFKL